MTLSNECAPAVFEILSTGTIVFAHAPVDQMRLYVCGGSITAEAVGSMTANWLSWTINAPMNRDVLIPMGLVPAGQALTIKWTSTGKVRGWISVRITQ